MWDKVKKTCMLLIWMLLAMLLVIIIVGSFAELNPDAGWICSYTKHKWLVLLCGVFVLSVFVIRLCHWFSEMKEQHLKWVVLLLLGIFVFGEMIMMHMFYVVPITDAYVIDDNAMALLQGITKKVDEYSSYFSYYGNNYFAVLLVRKLYYLMYDVGGSDPYKFLFWINSLCIIISVILTWMSARLIVGARKACMVLLLIVINPVFYGITFWAYTLTMSMPIMMGIVYLGVCFIKCRNKLINILTGAGMGILTVAGYYLRPTAVFPLIALVIVGICHFRCNRIHIRKLVLTGGVFLICAGISYMYVSSRISAYTTDTSRNLPVTHWVMMGLKDDGQFDGEDEKFSMSFASKEEAKEANIQVICERVSDMGPLGLVRHCLKKLTVTWCDGTHGFMDRLKQDTKFTILYTYMAEGKTDAIILYCQIYHIFLFLMALTACILQIIKKDWNAGMQLVTITFFGGIVFYLIWEAKNIYSIPFLMSVCVMASDGMNQIAEKRLNLCNRGMLIYRIACAATVILTLTAGIGQFKNYTSIDHLLRSYSVNMYSNPFCLRINDISSKNRSIVQEFYTDRAFNRIYVRATALKNAAESTLYHIMVNEMDGEMLAEKTVSAADLINKAGDKVTDGYIALDISDVMSDGKTGYNISITAANAGAEDSIEWWYRRSLTMDNYDGTMIVDDKARKEDLFLVVCEENKQPYTSAGIYITAVAVLLAGESFILWQRRVKARRNVYGRRMQR